MPGIFINKAKTNKQKIIYRTSVCVFIWITEALTTYCWTKSREKKKLFLNMMDSQKYIFLLLWWLCPIIIIIFFLQTLQNKREYILDHFKMHNFDW